MNHDFRKDNLLPDMGNAETLLRSQQNLLNAFFGSNWFVENTWKKERHPAYRRWQNYEKLISQQGRLSFPEDRATANTLATALLDSLIITTSSGGDRGAFSLGSFVNYGDEKVQQRIHNVLGTNTGFDSLMVEFGYAASQLLKGNCPVAYEEESWADFQVSVNTFPLPLLADCKKVYEDTSLNRFGKLVKKVNQQITAVGIDGYGLGVVDVTSQLPQSGLAWETDSIPTKVYTIAEAMSAEMKCKNTHVSAMLIQWDECVIIGSPLIIVPTFGTFEDHLSRPPIAAVCLRRKNHFVHHPRAKRPLPDDKCVKSEFTVYYNILG